MVEATPMKDKGSMFQAWVRDCWHLPSPWRRAGVGNRWLQSPTEDGCLECASVLVKYSEMDENGNRRWECVALAAGVRPDDGRKQKA